MAIPIPKICIAVDFLGSVSTSSPPLRPGRIPGPNRNPGDPVGCFVGGARGVPSSLPNEIARDATPPDSSPSSCIDTPPSLEGTPPANRLRDGRCSSADDPPQLTALLLPSGDGVDPPPPPSPSPSDTRLCLSRSPSPDWSSSIEALEALSREIALGRTGESSPSPGMVAPAPPLTTLVLAVPPGVAVTAATAATACWIDPCSGSDNRRRRGGRADLAAAAICAPSMSLSRFYAIVLIMPGVTVARRDCGGTGDPGCGRWCIALRCASSASVLPSLCWPLLPPSNL